MLGCETEKRILLSTTLQIARTDLNFALPLRPRHTTALRAAEWAAESL